MNRLPSTSGMRLSWSPAHFFLAAGFAVALGCLLLMPAGLTARPTGELVRDESGRGYLLYKKVVVIRGGEKVKLYKDLKDYPKVGNKLPAFSVFYRLAPAAGQPKELVQVGTVEGLPLGWVEETNTQDWNTRFVIEPIKPQPDCRFTFKTRIDSKEKDVPLDSLPEKGTHRCYGFVLEKPDETKDEDDSVYKIFISTGVQADSAGNATPFDEEETKLEIVFALESSDFMNKKFHGTDSRRLIDHLQDLVKRFVGEIGRDKELSKAVRLGFVQYWDNVPWRDDDKRLETVGLSAERKKEIEKRLREMSPKFPATVTCDLTEDVKLFSERMGKVSGTDLLDDWPDDVLAGLHAAVSKVKWSKNSVKHIILIGSASFQTALEGTRVSQYHPGPDNSVTKEPPAIPHGFNSTKLTIQELLDRAQPGAAGTSADLSHKFFHALFLPNEKVDLAKNCPKLDASKLALFRAQLAKVITAKEDQVNALFAQLHKDLLAELSSADTVKQYLRVMVRAHLVEYQASLARAQYSELRKNRTGGEGLFREVEPTTEDVKLASLELAKKIVGAFRYIKGLRSGDTLTKPKDNPLALPIWRLGEDVKNQFKRHPIALGTAKVRDKESREIAFRKIMVSRREMQRLAEVLDYWHTEFKKLGTDRKSPDKVLKALQESLGKTGLGQLELKKEKGKEKDSTLEDTTLEKMLNDLPMRSPALKVTPNDIRLMDDGQFTKWLKRIEDAARRCSKHLDDSDAWVLLSEGAVPKDDKYGFFLLSMMP